MCKSLPHDGVAQNPWCSHCLAVGVAFLLWLAPSLNSIQKYAGHAGLLVLPLAALSAMVALTATARRHGPGLPKSWLVALCAAPLALFIVLYPMADSGLLGPGSDRDDALNVALQTLLVGHYPYGATTYLGNPPTPMPGALILALPFFLLGNSALQNLVWVPIFTWWCLHHFESATMAFSCLAIFLIGCPASIADFVTGGDYLVNALYVAIAMDALLRAQRSGEPWHRYAASVFLSIAISSRPIYAVAAIILAGSIFQTAGISRMTEFLIVLVLVSVALNGPFFLHDPSRFPTASLLEKLSVFPHFMRATIVLPALGTAIACSSFFVPMTGDRIFGLMAGALVLLCHILS